jgi:DNA-binding response OmpR family regulator
MNGSRLLVVGQADGVARGWLEPLRSAGANVAVVGDGAEALRHLDMIEPELILIDLRLSGPIDGFDTCRAIRARSAAAIVIASTSDGAYDELVALAVGADHYLHADTTVEVVEARLRSLTRRARGEVVPDQLVSARGADPDTTAVSSGGTAGTRPGAVGPRTATLGARLGTAGRWVAAAEHGAVMNGTRTGRGRTGGDGSAGTAVRGLAHVPSGPDGPTERIVDGELVIDLVAREVHVGETLVELTRTEFDLLVALASHPRRVLSRDQLMMSAWDEPFDGSHVLDTHLSRMRCKILRAGGGRVAHAVRCVGYRLRA